MANKTADTKEPDQKQAESQTDKQAAEESYDEEKLGSIMLSALGFDPKAAKERAEKRDKPEKGAVEDEKAPTNKEQAADKTAKKEKKVEVERSEDEDDRIARIASASASAAAASATEAMLARMDKRDGGEKKSGDDNKVDALDGLTEDEKSDYEVYRHIAETIPSKKNIHTRFLEGVNKARAYEQKWRDENPGKEFDPEDEEHNDFYERIEPDVTEREFRKAEVAMEADRIAEEKLKKKLKDEVEPLKERQRQREAKEKVEELRTRIISDCEQTMASVLESILPNEAEAIKKNPEKASEIVKALEESDPEAFDVMRETSNAAMALIGETVKLWNSDGLVPFDPKNPVHDAIRKFSLSKEQEIKKLPPSKQVHGGKRFATWAEMEKMGAAERERHWVLTDQHIVQMLKGEFAANAKAQYEHRMGRIRKYAEKAGKTVEKQEKTEKEKASANGSPESGGGSKIDTSKKGDAVEDEELTKMTRSILFGR